MIVERGSVIVVRDRLIEKHMSLSKRVTVVD